MIPVRRYPKEHSIKKESPHCCCHFQKTGICRCRRRCCRHCSRRFYFERISCRLALHRENIHSRPKERLKIKKKILLLHSRLLCSVKSLYPCIDPFFQYETAKFKEKAATAVAAAAPNFGLLKVEHSIKKESPHCCCHFQKTGICRCRRRCCRHCSRRFYFERISCRLALHQENIHSRPKERLKNYV